MGQVTKGRGRSAVLIAQPALPPYRRAFLKALRERLPRLVVLSGRTRTDPSVAEGVLDLAFVAPAENRFFMRRRLLWQSPFRKIACFPGVAILDLNPRNISTWASLCVRLVLGRGTVLWGHAHGRSVRDRRLSRLLRLLQMRLARFVLVYTESELSELPSSVRGFAVGNGVYSACDMQGMDVDTNLSPAFLYSGRLIVDKEVLLLVESFAKLCAQVGEKYRPRLIVVGEGPEKGRLLDAVRSHQLENSVELVGSVWDRHRLKELYRRSSAAVCAGYVGLNAIQALSFGRPMIWREQTLLRHAPEVEALHRGNSVCIGAALDPVDGLADGMEDVCRNRQLWASRAQSIADEASKRYSVERMVDAFEQAISAAMNGPTRDSIIDVDLGG